MIAAIGRHRAPACDKCGLLFAATTASRDPSREELQGHHRCDPCDKWTHYKGDIAPNSRFISKPVTDPSCDGNSAHHSHDELSHPQHQVMEPRGKQKGRYAGTVHYGGSECDGKLQERRGRRLRRGSWTQSLNRPMKCKASRRT
jgi:hypothetical protein